MTFSNLAQVLLLTILLAQISSKAEAGASVVYKPKSLIEYRPLDVAHDSRRVLAPFQLCSECKCCAADDPTNCLSMPCCFGISCDIPDKPYGVCAFVPKSCNCTTCD